MKCSTCGSEDNRVLRADQVDDRIRRLRQCCACGARFRTFEVHVAVFERADQIAAAFEGMKSAIPGEA